ncbi:hypothetical protein [Acidianus brierleyi]|uniref:Uncharacterized protein n=1 Tax=Acidianus brierleyi TaxID=41673 RepID=A0A2U9IGJ7_9CREN|nr:hypothetical protein [Acidianus brierleyi]AWR95161.1 hypothetical protein DFR85_11690 [Acidianus brierleyi]
MSPDIIFKIILNIIGVIAIFYGIAYITLSSFNVMKIDRKVMRFMGSMLIGVSISIFIIAYTLL